MGTPLLESFDLAHDCLPLCSLPRLFATSQQLRRGLDTDSCWRHHCKALWQSKVYVAEHCRALLDRQPRAALRASLEDSRRDVITEEELCSMLWRFRFKAGAGRAWTRQDAWFNGGEPAQRRFAPGGELLRPGNAPASWTAASLNGRLMRWRFPSWVPVWSSTENRQPTSKEVQRGSRVRIADFPTASVWRHPNWGFVLEGPWTIMASLHFPPRSANEWGSISGARFRNRQEDAQLEIALYNADIELPELPPRPEDFFIRQQHGEEHFFLRDGAESPTDEASSASTEDAEAGESEALLTEQDEPEDSDNEASLDELHAEI